ncbi:MAG: PTS system nitrogen regulatory IIA [Geobacteraceae bacterium]|nr:MAG: PTS system nitrogen regulatory IIA [Geobacteraceae bacterium]
MKINLLLQPEDIIPALSSAAKEAVLNELAAKVVERHPGLDHAELLKILLEREKLGSTGIGDGIAIPHGKMKQAKGLVLVFGRSLSGVDFNALDDRKVNLFFLLVAPEDAVGIHLKMLARISRILKDPAIRKGLLEAPDAAAIFKIIREQDSRY